MNLRKSSICSSTQNNKILWNKRKKRDTSTLECYLWSDRGTNAARKAGIPKPTQRVPAPSIKLPVSFLQKRTSWP